MLADLLTGTVEQLAANPPLLETTAPSVPLRSNEKVHPSPVDDLEF